MTPLGSLVGLPPMDVAGRLPRLQEQLDDAGCDCLLVTHLVNIRYLTGFSGSAALLIVRRAGATLVTDGRYTEQAHAELADAGAAAEVAVGHTRTEQRDLVTASVD